MNNSSCTIPVQDETAIPFYLLSPFLYMHPNLTLLQHLGGFLYIVNPKVAVFDNISDVPDYVVDAMPIFITLVFIEMGIHWLRGNRILISDYIASGGIGVIHLATNFILFNTMLNIYDWLYQFRLMEIPGNSVYTWIAALFLVDLAFYWTHRAHHELNVLWMFHQVHHSAEDFNFAVPLRLPILLKVTYFFLYLPLAIVGIPTSSTLVHSSLNLLFDFWLHTKLVPHLGPIEWFLMTPSSHRVHHGANEWCLDKNYGSVFIIWDRIFGTYQPERTDEEIVYGLTTQPMSHNGLWHQFYYFGEFFRKIRDMSSWGDRLKAVFYGPGWSPGTPRLGDPDTMTPVPVPRTQYDPKLPLWQVLYIISHLLAGTVSSQMMMNQVEIENWLSVARHLFFILTSVGVVTSMIDGWWLAPMAEVLRCVTFTAYARFWPITSVPLFDTSIAAFYTMCSLFWISYGATTRRGYSKTKLS